MIKKFLTVLIVLALASPAFAAKVRYRISTGDIVCMANMKEDPKDLGTDEAVITVGSPVLNNIDDYTVKNGEFREKNKQEKDAMKQAELQAKADRKAKKKALMQKLNMTQDDMKALLALVSDRTDE